MAEKQYAYLVSEYNPGQIKLKTIKMVFVDSLLSMLHDREKAKTDWLVIVIICLSGRTCLPKDCCFSELAL